MSWRAALAALLMGLALQGSAWAADPLALLHKVNRYWQARNPPADRAFWDIAAYHTGNMEAWKLTGDPAYLAYSEAWARHNQWMGARSPERANWKYTYGETDEFVLFGDWQICFQTYADLYRVKPDAERIARAREVMEYQMSTPRQDYWWWADGLYMVMPVMTKLYNITGDARYLEKLHVYFQDAVKVMYDREAGLFYRDARYVYPQHKSVNGIKDFWARGDGWVFAGLARVLAELPPQDAHRAEYVAIFQRMAKALKDSQQQDGYWTRSLLDPAHAPGPETSGTAFFTFGLAWGLNHGLLDKASYAPVLARSRHYLETVAIDADGKVGYVQPIGDRAIPGQVVDKNLTAPFGVGAVLLALAELHRYDQANKQ